MHHLIERRCDQAAETNDVGTHLDRFVEDLVTRHHHSHVGDFEAIAGQHDADDVLADVVDISLHGGEHDLACAALCGVGELFLLHVWLQVGDTLLHDAGAFHHLRQEHFPGAKQVAHDAHTIHERAFDHRKRFA